MLLILGEKPGRETEGTQRDRIIEMRPCSLQASSYSFAAVSLHEIYNVWVTGSSNFRACRLIVSHHFTTFKM